MPNCTALGPGDSPARICTIDTWRQLHSQRRLHLTCLGCEIRLGRNLLELGQLTGSRPEPRLGARIPLAINAYDLGLPGKLFEPLGPAVDQIGYTPVATVLAGWVGLWRDWDCPAGGVRSYGSAWSLTSWFRDRLPWACRVYDGLPKFAGVVWSLLRAVRREAGVDMPGARLSLPCPRCEAASLMHGWTEPAEGSTELSEPFVDCSACGWWWDLDEYAEAKGAQLRGAIPSSTLLTAAEIAIARPGVPARRVRVWAHRGRLAPHPGPWGARAFYELGDVDALVDREVAVRLARHEAERAMMAV